MSSSTPGQSSAPPSDFKSILDAALREYKRKIGKPLLDNALAAELQGCESVDHIMAILQDQVGAFQKAMAGDQRWKKLISQAVDVIPPFMTLSERVSGSCVNNIQALMTVIPM